MSYEDLLQEILKMNPEDRKQNVVMVQEYSGNVYHPVYLESTSSFSRNYGEDWEIVIR
jgi:hypothetical protein